MRALLYVSVGVLFANYSLLWSTALDFVVAMTNLRHKATLLLSVLLLVVVFFVLIYTPLSSLAEEEREDYARSMSRWMLAQQQQQQQQQTSSLALPTDAPQHLLQSQLHSQLQQSFQTDPNTHPHFDYATAQSSPSSAFILDSRVLPTTGMAMALSRGYTRNSFSQ